VVSMMFTVFCNVTEILSGTSVPVFQITLCLIPEDKHCQ
jgi:hypothetical protein